LSNGMSGDTPKSVKVALCVSTNFHTEKWWNFQVPHDVMEWLKRAELLARNFFLRFWSSVLVLITLELVPPTKIRRHIVSKQKNIDEVHLIPPLSLSLPHDSKVVEIHSHNLEGNHVLCCTSYIFHFILVKHPLICLCWFVPLYIILYGTLWGG
jgi:hypothetical protein